MKKEKYTEEMLKSQKDKTDVDNSQTYLELRTMEMTIATNALSKDPSSKSLKAAENLKTL